MESSQPTLAKRDDRPIRWGGGFVAITMTRKTLLERAFELAEGGEAGSMTELRLRLKAEGYADVAAHLEGRLIKAQLVKAMRGTRQGEAG